MNSVDRFRQSKYNIKKNYIFRKKFLYFSKNNLILIKKYSEVIKIKWKQNLQKNLHITCVYAAAGKLYIPTILKHFFTLLKMNFWFSSSGRLLYRSHPCCNFFHFLHQKGLDAFYKPRFVVFFLHKSTTYVYNQTDQQAKRRPA